MNISPQRQVAASKVARSTSSSSPSTRRNSTLAMPWARALSRATSSISAAMSVPRTNPEGPAIVAAGRAGSPVPEAMSRTRWPGPTAASSRGRLGAGGGARRRARQPGGAAGLEGGDVRFALEGEGDVVQPLEEPLADEGVDVERLFEA